MNWNARSIIGLGVGTFALTMFAEGVYHIVGIGSCASGGPYAVARQCPAGIGLWVAALTGGVLVPLVAFAIGAVPRVGLVTWCGLFLGGGGALAVAALDGSARGSGARLTAWIVAAAFVSMGLPPLVAALVRAAKWQPVVPTDPGEVTQPQPAGLDPGSAPELGDLLGNLQDRPTKPGSES